MRCDVIQQVLPPQLFSVSVKMKINPVRYTKGFPSIGQDIQMFL